MAIRPAVSGPRSMRSMGVLHERTDGTSLVFDRNRAGYSRPPRDGRTGSCISTSAGPCIRSTRSSSTRSRTGSATATCTPVWATPRRPPSASSSSATRSAKPAPEPNSSPRGRSPARGYVRLSSPRIGDDVDLIHSAQFMLRNPPQALRGRFRTGGRLRALPAARAHAAVGARTTPARHPRRPLQAPAALVGRGSRRAPERRRRQRRAQGHDASGRRSVPRQRHPKTRGEGPLRVLFVGTAFYEKGGVEAVRAATRARERPARPDQLRPRRLRDAGRESPSTSRPAATWSSACTPSATCCCSRATWTRSATSCWRRWRTACR